MIEVAFYIRSFQRILGKQDGYIMLGSYQTPYKKLNSSSIKDIHIKNYQIFRINKK